MRGQAFTTFKLLIGAVLAVALLVIAYAVASQIMTPYTGVEAARDLVLQAKKAPGLCFVKQNAAFVQDETLTGTILEQITNTQSVSVMESPPLSGGRLTQDATVPLAAKCASTDSCTVWFNKAACP